MKTERKSATVSGSASKAAPKPGSKPVVFLRIPQPQREPLRNPTAEQFKAWVQSIGTPQSRLCENLERMRRNSEYILAQKDGTALDEQGRVASKVKQEVKAIAGVLARQITAEKDMVAELVNNALIAGRDYERMMFGPLVTEAERVRRAKWEAYERRIEVVLKAWRDHYAQFGSFPDRHSRKIPVDVADAALIAAGLKQFKSVDAFRKWKSVVRFDSRLVAP